METKRSWQALWRNQTMECECYRWKQESAIHSETYTQEFEQKQQILTMEEDHVRNKNGSEFFWYTTTILGSFTTSKA
jgi:hypothetical protein